MNVKVPNWLRQRTPLELATRELDEAKRDLLLAQSGLDYATGMVKYHTDRIKRLTHYINIESKEV